MDRAQPGVGLCGIHPCIPILSFLEDPRLGFRLVLLFGRAAPGQALGNPWDPSLEPKFLSLMPSSSFLGEPQLQGCSLPHILGCLPQGSFLLQSGTLAPKAAFFNPDEANQWEESVHSSSFLPFLLLFLWRPGGGFLQSYFGTKPVQTWAEFGLQTEVPTQGHQ